MLFELAAENAIQTSKDACGIASVKRLAGQSDLEHGGDQCGRDAMSSDVGDKDANPPLVDQEEVVEIAGHGTHGYVARCNFKTREGWDTLRKRRGLNPAGYFQFFVDSEKSFFVREGTIGGDVA